MAPACRRAAAAPSASPAKSSAVHTRARGPADGDCKCTSAAGASVVAAAADAAAPLASAPLPFWEAAAGPRLGCAFAGAAAGSGAGALLPDAAAAGAGVAAVAFFAALPAGRTLGGTSPTDARSHASGACRVMGKAVLNPASVLAAAPRQSVRVQTSSGAQQGQAQCAQDRAESPASHKAQSGGSSRGGRQGRGARAPFSTGAAGGLREVAGTAWGSAAARRSTSAVSCSHWRRCSQGSSRVRRSMSSRNGCSRHLHAHMRRSAHPPGRHHLSWRQQTLERWRAL